MKSTNFLFYPLFVIVKQNHSSEIPICVITTCIFTKFIQKPFNIYSSLFHINITKTRDESGLWVEGDLQANVEGAKVKTAINV